MSNQDTKREVVILGAARTPVGKLMGALSHLSAPDLGALAVKTAVERAGIDPSTVYEVIMGHVVSAGTGQAPARQAALRAGLTDNVGAASVNKVCGSGLKAVMLAANAIAAGEAEVYVAGGMESMSQAPYLLPDARQGLRYGHGRVLDAILKDGLWCAFQDWAMGNAAEFIARQFEVSREEMDEFALCSHEKAAAATAAGRFQEEVVPVEVKSRQGVSLVTQDEPIRATFDNGGYTLATSLEQLAKLPPAFEEGGQVTAGNAPGLNDGAAALVVTSRAEAERQGLKPMARIAGYTHAAVHPQWIFAAPARAIPRLLDRLGWTMADVDLIELNEAFAAQVLADGAEMIQKGYDWDWDKVNVNGGAVALGHPIGASGARLLVTLIYALRQRNRKRGIASLCLGGGEAVALAIELE
ncbi:MAG: acetyl-CoA C-acyltransferase [Chloroflexi bacterium]|nr:acetyl-CoA C-acyltransferase [Chloroflexota bacterium]MCI0577994.1 acetyl-CoA C-acyltransferase [Chloroflexota bacterium]MCI0646977.1 acetyl-CoA C-acyltransferase [Chloroflexota bacterium]MCI0729264.1 acetyl-CoA C-acyltransferase [Chloroflexota bacterium]